MEYIQDAEDDYLKRTDLLKSDKDQLKLVNSLVLLGLLVTGIHTTSTSLKWSIMCLANNSDILAKLYDEINGKVGKNLVIRLNDREHLPYLEAFILEVQRTKTIIPVAPHFTKVPSKLNG